MDTTCNTKVGTSFISLVLKVLNMRFSDVKDFSVKNNAEIQKVRHFLTALKGFYFDRLCGRFQRRLFCEPDTM